MFRQIMQTAVLIGFCASCTPALAADNLPFSPSTAPNPNSALCPPGQVAASRTGQLWVNQAELHTAWDCFVPRPHAFAARPSQGADPAQRAALPAFAGTRASSAPGSRPAASPTPSQPAPVQVKLDVAVDVNLQVSANGEPVAAKSGQVSLPAVNIDLTGTGAQTNAGSASNLGNINADSALAPLEPKQGVQDLPPIVNQTANSEDQAIPIFSPQPILPELPAPGITTPGAIEPGPAIQTDALLNAKPILPNQSENGNRSLVSPRV